MSNSQLTFPYPTVGGPVRPPGNGCTACVHKEYCQALYWFERYVQRSADDHNGTNCASWSNNPADQIHTWSQADIDDNERMNREGILVEPNPSGITEPTTGAPDKPPF